MSDDYTEVSSESWLSRIGSSIKGIFFGFALFGISFVLLGWNEYRSVVTANSLGEAQSVVISVDNKEVSQANQGKLVHVTGKAVPGDAVADSTFGISTNVLQLKRIVEMYQWKEKKEEKEEKELGGSTKKTTTYKYSKEWSGEIQDSAQFKNTDARQKNRNPNAMPYQSNVVKVQEATVGAFELNQELIGQINEFQPLAMTSETLASVPEETAQNLKVNDGGYYRGSDPGNPAIGDLRIKFEIAPSCDVSILAQQTANGFSPWQAKAGDQLQVLYTGILTSAEIIKKQMEANAMLTWILRFVGFIMMFIGLNMMVAPFAVLADVLPFMGNIVGAGTSIVCGLIAFALSLMTIALVWILVRPIIAIPLLLLGFAAIIGVIFLIVSYSKKKTAPAPAY
ncbi:MAG TPA: TMEM43 family protein [Candidatus Methylacidiphilales bacterium]|nr:TMEM43 family protein [Candidatus Methylacidiphilales bacterium]